MSDNFDILSKAAAGDPEAEAQAVHILLQANRVYFRNNFTIPLQRCCGIPGSVRQLMLPRLHYWLRVAHTHCDASTSWKKSQALSEEIKRLKSIFWERWSALSLPPEGQSELRNALFHASKIAEKIKPEAPMNVIPDTARQLDNIVKNSQADISQQHGQDEAWFNETRINHE